MRALKDELMLYSILFLCLKFCYVLNPIFKSRNDCRSEKEVGDSIAILTGSRGKIWASSNTCRIITPDCIPRL
jgi:hypothetical protein